MFSMMLLRHLPALAAYGLFQVLLRSKDDSRLAKRLKNRTPQALSEVYGRYGRLVYSLIYRVVRDPDAAEDLAQETFLRVWNRISSFDPERGALGPWIVTIARNRAIDYLRSAGARIPARSLDLARMELPALFAGLEDAALSIDRTRRLKSAFEKLSPNQRTVIELAYFEGLSQTEMAERMKQPLGTVRTWVHSALKVLRQETVEAAIA